MVRKTQRDVASDVLPRYTFNSRGFIGSLFGRTESVDVELVDFGTSWDAKGVMRWKFTWDVPVPKVDVGSLREQIAGGISDGWGEGVEQMSRFGELCATDDNGKWRLATPKERKGLATYEAGRYAVLLTTVGAKFVVK